MAGFQSKYGSLIRCVGFVFAVMLLIGCGSKSAPTTPETPADPAAQGTPGKPKIKPSIAASPNPVPASAEKFGKTMITWDTGDGTPGEVYVSTNGGEEKRFSGALAKGSQEAAWIGSKGEYEFRLYAGKDHTTMLTSVKVRRKKE